MRAAATRWGAGLVALLAVGGLALGARVLASTPNVKPDGPALDLSGYQITFEDDFAKPDVVAHGPFSQHAPGMRWIAHTPWNGDFGEARFADPGPGGPFGFGPDGLTITALKQDDGHWRSGLICSVDRDGAGQQGFVQRYGYFEMRAKLPEGPGTWPAFWLVGTDKSNGSAEIDVMEYYGKFSDSFHTTLHIWKSKDGVNDDHVVLVPDRSLTQAYHDYGVRVGPDRMTFYLDHIQFLDVATPPAFRQPMYLLANLALGGGWAVDGLDSPAVMRIARIRAYRDMSGPP
ncbi:glycoside hydrolase family 16 protein [Lichenibacterium minor]|uniref:Glycoside hydrolase family 16 protein n=1 Tax=Lichenibacterium minor TaxID=2316528 RepID=A0A4Q2U077_9HYPH|nr:glycoside hydrolase family 16 protein [Lichenibacterium minor]RYC29460.1 glycoside hydrolase family 16 protein [Lichenibacterium minor]